MAVFEGASGLADSCMTRAVSYLDFILLVSWSIGAFNASFDILIIFGTISQVRNRCQAFDTNWCIIVLSIGGISLFLYRRTFLSLDNRVLILVRGYGAFGDVEVDVCRSGSAILSLSVVLILGLLMALHEATEVLWLPALRV